MIKYCESVYETKRLKTRTVMVGNVGIGGNNPVRIQSMTTSNTRDVEATIEQVVRLTEAGCEIVRMTVQGIKEAEACDEIKNGLLKRGVNTPLVADIHFFPPAAMRVADSVDKVRINPGNFVDKRASFKQIEYDDLSYEKELEKIEAKFTPLVEKCKRLKRAMRIGTNHGSLSDRIMNRYGDTPQGMVESALEFARICRKNDYHDIVFSMKASNPRVMILAYRLLSAEMLKLGWDYPMHLGVTEAGEGEDGRIKSAMGIGTLLLDGIGDTIRVSLTEDPWYEIDPCKSLIRLSESFLGTGIAPFHETHRRIENIQRRHVFYPQQLAMHRDGTVLIAADAKSIASSDFFQKMGCEGQLGLPKIKFSSADCLVLKNIPQEAPSLKKIQQMQEIGIGLCAYEPFDTAVRVLTLEAAIQEKKEKDLVRRFAASGLMKPEHPLAIIVDGSDEHDWEPLREIKPSIVLLAPSKNRLHVARLFFEWIQNVKLDMPVILHFSYNCPKDDLILLASMECGSLLCDGLGDGLYLDGPYEIEFLRNLSFSILQAARMRMSKTDFISCPSCGRTLFNLQDVTKRIRSRTAHLPGVKIAIMGCIVNGPGEMADADFGYVGSKPGKIDLYVGKDCVEKDIDFADADNRLVELIKTHGRWQEPPQD